jgi:hypothetical protein
MCLDSRKQGRNVVRVASAWTMAVLLALLPIPAAHATAPAALAAFTVQTLDGSTVSTATWTMQGKSLLIYVEANCQPCATLLARLVKKDYPQIAAHAIVIVGGSSPTGTKAVMQLYPELATASWFADPSRATLPALSLSGAPVIMGINGKTVQWSLSGVMKDPEQQRSVLNSWLTK